MADSFSGGSNSSRSAQRYGRLIPLRGVSAIDKEGRPFWWLEADQALFQSIRNWIGPQVRLVELDLHINDPAFARAAVETLLSMMKEPRTK